MAPTSSMRTCRFGWVIIKVLALLVTTVQAVHWEPEGLENTHQYLEGLADPDSDPNSLITPEGYICSNLTRQCYCQGPTCPSLLNIVVYSNVTVLTLTHASIERVTSRSYTSVPQLEVLEIIQSGLRIIDPYSFHGLRRLKLLNLSYNKIFQLSPDAFKGLDSLEELVLMMNKIQSFDNLVPAIVPGILPSLRLLHVSGNSLKKIGEFTFKPLRGTKIDYLHSMFCSFNYIHPKGLEPLNKLKTLMMRGNPFWSENFLVSVFENRMTPELKVLDIGGPGLTQIPTLLLKALASSKLNTLSIYELPMTALPNNSFPEMPNLLKLALRGNHLQEMQAGAFDPLYNLKSLELPRNLLSEFPVALKIPHLIDLNLNGLRNQVLRFKLPDFSFSTMSLLQSLDLSYKSLLTLNENTFHGLSNLTLLNLRKCGINSVKDGTFLHLTSLRTLDISQNPLFELGSVSEKLFYGLQGTLNTLFLQDVGYQGDNDRFWNNLEELEVLDIANNSLPKISGIAPRLANLKKIYASYNSIQDWSETILNGNSSIETLDLSYNLIRTVTAAMITDFEKVHYLNITHNHFECKCDFLDFVLWLNSTSTSVSLYAGLRTPRNKKSICSYPEGNSLFSVSKVQSTLESSCDMTIPRRKRFILASAGVMFIVIFTFVLFVYLYIRRRVRTAIWDKQVLPNEHFVYDAFVSYSANDSDWVINSLLPHMESNSGNLKLCVYDRDFLAGEAITDCILESIRNSRRVLLVVSKNFVKSPWCRIETELARHVLLDNDREGLLLIKLGELDLSQINAHLRFLLSTRLYLSWSSDPKEQDEFWRKLRRTLENNSKFAKIVSKERSPTKASENTKTVTKQKSSAM